MTLGEWLNRMIVEGDATRGTLACQQIQLGKKGNISLANATFKHMIVTAGANVEFDEQLKCRNLDIEGTLRAKACGNSPVRARDYGSP